MVNCFRIIEIVQLQLQLHLQYFIVSSQYIYETLTISDISFIHSISDISFIHSILVHDAETIDRLCKLLKASGNLF